MRHETESLAIAGDFGPSLAGGVPPLADRQAADVNGNERMANCYLPDFSTTCVKQLSADILETARDTINVYTPFLISNLM